MAKDKGILKGFDDQVDLVLDYLCVIDFLRTKYLIFAVLI